MPSSPESFESQASTSLVIRIETQGQGEAGNPTQRCADPLFGMHTAMMSFVNHPG